MSKRVTKQCEKCGNEFSYFPSCNPERHYCSQACRSAAKRIDTTCPACGKEFWYNISWPRIYCSHKCSTSVNAKRNLGIVELPQQFCEQCGDEITKDKRSNRRFCSADCFGAWLSTHNVGEAHPTYSQTERTCRQCDKTFKAQPNAIAKGWGNFCCRSCAATWQQANMPNAPRPPALSGPDNKRWKGGVLPYYGPNWRPQRRNARHRDNYTCQRCGITESVLGRQLDVHHITPFREFGIDRYQEANQTSNLISLCNVCHLITENQP